MSVDTLKTGFYLTEINTTSWVVPERYQNLTLIGEGAYGQVCEALDTSTGVRVAVKKFNQPFVTPFLAKRMFKEIRLLQQFDHENVVNFLSMFTPDRSLEDFRDFYFVMPYAGSDLSSILKHRSLESAQVQFIIYQILRGLKYIHSAGVIHMDLKPDNISINENNELKILDFGLARFKGQEKYGYMVCRCYRAPEIILGCMPYDEKVDMWSVGCILGEILARKPLFDGADPWDQLMKMLSLVGKPPPEFIGKMASEDARNFFTTLLPQLTGSAFYQVFEEASKEAINFLERTLDLNPETRISVYEALKHPYVAEFHDPDDEPTPEIVDSWFEDLDLDSDEWRRTVNSLADLSRN